MFDPWPLYFETVGNHLSSTAGSLPAVLVLPLIQPLNRASSSY